jgi:hypothetical protein
MPAKPRWIIRIPDVIRQLEALPRPFVDRATLELLLQVGRRRAQQILAPCVTDRVGTNGLADRDAVVARLRRLAEAPEAEWEIRRRQKVAGVIAGLQRERRERPQLLVEAPTQVVNQELTSLPAGVRLQPGRITVDFQEPHEALEKLLALAMAVRNDFEAFEAATGHAHGYVSGG